MCTYESICWSALCIPCPCLMVCVVGICPKTCCCQAAFILYGCCNTALSFKLSGSWWISSSAMTVNFIRAIVIRTKGRGTGLKTKVIEQQLMIQNSVTQGMIRANIDACAFSLLLLILSWKDIHHFDMWNYWWHYCWIFSMFYIVEKNTLMFLSFQVNCEPVRTTTRP